MRAARGVAAARRPARAACGIMRAPFSEPAEPSMSQRYPAHIWHNGAIKPWAEATTHVMAHALHYGSSVFEGIRAYDVPGGTAIFRLTDHMKRLYTSAKVYDI